MTSAELPGVRRSPNIWDNPDVYERQNAGVDPDGNIETAMARIQDWTGLHLLDLGCGAGYHLPRWARRAGRVTGVEPHPPLVAGARRRVAADPATAAVTTVLAGSAEAVPLPDASVDVTQARWAYFFGPGCEPGLRELERVTRPGGVAFVIDNDPTRSTFGAWFRRAWPRWDPGAGERFWRRQGFTREPVDIEWRFPDRATFEDVVRIEFPADPAAAILAEHPGTGVDYALNLWWRRY